MKSAAEAILNATADNVVGGTPGRGYRSKIVKHYPRVGEAGDLERRHRPSRYADNLRFPSA
jgi:hypothetical protein